MNRGPLRLDAKIVNYKTLNINDSSIAWKVNLVSILKEKKMLETAATVQYFSPIALKTSPMDFPDICGREEYDRHISLQRLKQAPASPRFALTPKRSVRTDLLPDGKYTASGELLSNYYL